MLTEGAEAEAQSLEAKDAIQHVVGGVLFGVRSGLMVPGQHLVETDLTRQLGVSRGSLREGLKRLSSDGIVTLTRYRGAFISALDRKSVEDLLDVLELLCSLAARRAAENCLSATAKDDLLTLASGLDDQARDGRARTEYLARRHHFYELLIVMGGNRELGRVIPLARADLFRSQLDRVQTREQRRRHAKGYLQIAEGVVANNPSRAEKAVRKHFAATRKTVATLPDEAFFFSPG